MNASPTLRATRLTLHGARVVAMSITAVLIGQLAAAPVDETKLPPAATNKIDFLRDIKPILDGSCLKCHGPEKPKSHFRIDHREALLKGGDNGVAVIPGESAKSPLIHFVARFAKMKTGSATNCSATEKATTAIIDLS